MEVKLDEVIYLDFVTHRFDTGVVTDDDATPTYEVFENDTDTALTITGGAIAKRTAKTGNYRIKIPCTSANGFVSGRSYNVVATSTVNSLTGKGVVGTFIIRTNSLSDLGPYLGSDGKVLISEDAQTGTNFALNSEVEAISNLLIIKSGTVVDAAPTTLKVTTSLTEATADYWNKAAILWSTGAANAGVIRSIKDYKVASGEITFETACPVLPVNGDAFKIVMLRAFHLGGLDPTEIQTACDAAITANADIDAILEDTGTTLETHITDIKGTGFAKDTDSLVNLSHKAGTKGTDAIYDEISGLGFTGSQQATITVYVTGGTTPIPDAYVTVLNSAQTAVIGVTYTNASGQVVLALDNGIYKIRLRKAGYTFTVPETLTVSGTTTATYYGTAIVIGTPVDVNACRVYDYCFLADDATPMTSVDSDVRIVSLPYDYDDKLHSGDEITGTYNSTTGLIYWDVVRESEIRVKIKNLGLNVVVEVPDVTTARLSDLL